MKFHARFLKSILADVLNFEISSSSISTRSRTRRRAATLRVATSRGKSLPTIIALPVRCSVAQRRDARACGECARSTETIAGRHPRDWPPAHLELTGN
eukprot:983705-Pleurochrysis_carterae.AAC.2